MAITKAQAGNTATGTSTTPSATLTSGPTPGNAILFTFASGPAISSNGNLTLIDANSTASSVGILWMPVLAGTSGTQSITLVGSSAWGCRIDEITGSPSGEWVVDQHANSTSPGSETTRAFSGGTTSFFVDEYAIAVAGFNISETSVPWNSSLSNDTTNLLNGTRSLTVASRVLTTAAVSFTALACGAWTTAGTTGGFAFATLAAIAKPKTQRPNQSVARAAYR